MTLFDGIGYMFWALVITCAVCVFLLWLGDREGRRNVR